MKVELRNPNIIMKLSRLGSFHQSKLSFLRSFLKEFKNLENGLKKVGLNDVEMNGILGNNWFNFYKGIN